ncbi:MAG: DUF4465 domain-containing protein [Muribaculaceae bacterium]|nr:DUF4465 domain-containing protein [Muribaculaceae bacterium]
MKRISSFLIAALTLSTIAYADAEVWNHPKKDVHPAECDKTVGPEGVIYRSMDYPSNPPTYYGGWVTFTSENEGEPVSITFTEFNCTRADKPIVFVYDGDAELQANFTGYSKPAPEGYMVAVMPENEGVEYTAQSGKLCVLYAPPQAGSGTITGTYTATVTAGTPHDMTFVGATATNGAAKAWRGARNVSLMTLDIATDGTLNPFTDNSLTIDVAGLAASGKVENIRLYASAVCDDAALAATLGAGETSLSVSGFTLKRNTPFTVVADIRPDVTGELPTPSVSSLVVGGEARITDTSAIGDVEIGNYILMGNNGSHITYVIGDDTPFYDGGGKDSPIPLLSEGTVTFLPSPGSDAVRIDFSSFKLFDNSSAISVGNNDVMRVYNGREADDANLITELVTESKTVKSTAADGALTVWFRSKQQNESGRAPGWEATVSHFTPSQMTLEAIEGEGCEAVAYAGETNVVLAYFNVKTNNQLNALNVSEIKLGVPAGAESVALEKAAVYYLGEYKNASLSKCYGEKNFSATGVAIEGSQTLREGDNWFAVAVELSPEALNEMKGAVSLVSVTTSAGAAVPAAEISGNVTVSNHCAMTVGSHSHTLYSEWEFLSPAVPPTAYSDNYPAVNADHIVTFYPSDEGAVVEMEFSEFDVYYSSSSWSTKATFEVYSGTELVSSNLVWKLDNADLADKGPGKKLRSTSADGALTVRFNPNTTSSYYTAKGWKAGVRQYFDHDAVISKVDVSQASTAILAPGATGQELIDFNIYTDGLQNPLTLSGLTFRLKGASQLKSVSVLSAGDKADFADAKVWGSLTVEAGNETVTVSPAGDNAPLADQDNWFRLVADVNDAVESDIEVDAALTGVSTSNGVSLNVENGDPEGVRLTKNIYIMQAGTATVNVDKALMFYDDGGPDGNFTTKFEGSVTFIPPVGKIISVNTVACGMGASNLTVYSGHEADNNAILGKPTGYTGVTGPENLFSKADDGSVTITFTGASYTSASGFEIAVTPVDPVAHAVEAVITSAASDEDVTRGSVNVPLLHAAVSVSGNYGKLSFGEIKADFTSSDDVADILNASLYFTGTSASFSTASAVGTKCVLDAGVATFTLEEPVTVDEHGEYHFWIGADLSNAATPDNLASASLSAMTANGEPVEVPADAFGRHIITGMGGSYIVGASDAARYKTIAAAVNSLKFGVEDRVEFLLEDGEYKENITVANVQGTSAEHPVVFTSLSGNRDAVRITGTLDTQNPMVTVENTSYVEFRALTFAASSSNYPSVVNFKNSSRHGVVDNCVVTGAVASGSTGTSLVKTETGADTNQNCDYFTVSNSYFENGYISLYLGGSMKVADPKDTGLTVSGNTIVNPLSKGVYVADCENFTVIGNTVTADNVAKSNFNGMDIYRPKGAFRVDGNKVNLIMTATSGSTSVSAYGLYLRGVRNNEMGSPDPANPAMVVNNVVNISNSNNYSTYGIYLYNEIKNTLVAHNTSRVSGTATVKSGYAMGCAGVVAPANSGITVANNIFQSISLSSPLNVWDDADYSSISFSGNVYYGGSGNVDNQSPQHTMDEYRALSGDQTSVWSEVSFLSDTDLHLLEVSENMAMPRIEQVAYDADGKERSETVTPGAYEFAEASEEAPVIAEGYPVVATVTDESAVIRTMWSEGGRLYSAIMPETDAAPDADELKSGRGVAIEADKEVTTTFRFLDQLTGYKAYFLAVSALGVESEIVAAGPFTTLETIDPLVVEIDFDADEAVAEGSSLTLDVIVEGGKAPFSYEWTDHSGETVGSDRLFACTPAVSTTYRVTVTSADGQVARAKAPVKVLNTRLHTAGFDEHPLAPESYWMYDTTLDEDEVSDRFFSGSFSFPNYPNFKYQSWGGYCFANETSVEFRDYHDQFRNCVGGGANGSANYGVAYMYTGWFDMTVDVMASDSEGLAIPGIYVTNSAYTLNSILNGDGYCPAFGEGDYYTLLIEGLDASGNVKATVEIPLADYRTATGAREARGEIVTDWKWVDLSPLGRVNKIRFDYDASPGVKFKVPSYVCFDNLGATEKIDGLDNVGVSVAVTTPTANTLSVSGIEGDFTLRIYSTDGILRGSHSLSGASVVSTAGLDSGAYIAEIVAASGSRSVARFVKR